MTLNVSTSEDEWSEQNCRQQSLDELQDLADTIQARNLDLSETEAEELADRFSREVIEEMVAEGKIKYNAVTG